MTSFIKSASYNPIPLARTREILASDAAGLIARLGAAATGPGHNAVIAADFSAPAGRGPLAGIPVGIKDNIDVAGFATTGGSGALRDHCARTDAPAVAALRGAGAALTCKLNMHELAFGVTSDNPAFGPVFNPFDPARTAGGSSGGSAAAVARGIVSAALGTDTGGSVRIPASFCGVVGFRPSTGRYPAGGVLPLSPSRDTIGPIAASVADVAEIDTVIAGLSETPRPRAPGKVRLGLPADALPGLCDPVEDVFRAALGRLEALGVIELVALPGLDLDRMETDSGLPIVFNEAPDIWAAFCETTLGLSLREFAATLGDPHVRATFMEMPALKAATAGRYRALMDHDLAALRAHVAGIFSIYGIDFMVMPTAVVQPPRWEEAQILHLKGGDHPTFMTVVRNACLATLTGAPSLSLPAGLDRDGLPVGLMLDGRPGQDRDLLACGIWLEQYLPLTGQPADFPPAG